MQRADCPDCGTPVVVVALMAEPDEERYRPERRVVLEPHEVAKGPDRYAIWDDGTARKVTERADVLAYPEHVCRRPTIPR